jgi:mycofactocin system glycosyltransferase
LTDQGYIHPSFTGGVDIDDIDVIVPVFDDADGLQRLLPALAGWAVTVVDDASTRPEPLRDLCQFYGASYIARDINGGPGAARNTGAVATSRPYLWFIDSDVRVDGITDTAPLITSALHDPRVGAVAPRIRGDIGTTSRERFDERFGPLDLGEKSALVVPGGRVSYVPSASLLVRRSAFGEGFDESLRTGEDVDFVWRLHDRGWLVRYEPTVVQRHRSRRSWSAWVAQRYHYGRSAAELAERHPERLSPVRLDPVTVLIWLAVATRQWKFAAALTDSYTSALTKQLPEATSDRATVARQLSARALLQSFLPTARAITRSYLPVVVLALAFRRSRKIAALLVVAGTAERLRHEIPEPRDIVVSVLDDAAYSAGVWSGVRRNHRWDALRPRVAWRSMKALNPLPQRSPVVHETRSDDRS